VLKGFGTALALPFLDADDAGVRARQERAVGAAPLWRRLRAERRADWQLADDELDAEGGRELEITPILTPLAEHRDLRDGDRQPVARRRQERDGSRGQLRRLVERRRRPSRPKARTSASASPSIRCWRSTSARSRAFPSLEFATEDFSGYIGGCVPGYSCTYMNTISWAGETSPLPMEINPRVAFERMFGAPATPRAASPDAREPQHPRLDRDEAKKLQQRVGTQDRARLSDYLDDVREIERRIQRTEAGNAASVTSVAAPVGIPEAFEEHAAQMFDLLAVAFQADLTRVFTYMMAREASMRTSRARHQRGAPRRVASRQRGGQDAAAREDHHALHGAVSRSSSRS
jgi:hypothetical protein